ncbi:MULTISPECIES: hypothetical protein [unclassified Exiguobacterium]|uniref:hypothetical protein n=1 Tax=unclassified Exiguobacterium TaxID=2644629 RepID=UPI001BECA471|nr:MULTISPECIES: hypothetical protein [unclassified Exiguobacterium]
MKYFAERNNQLADNFSIDLEDLKKYFYQTYRYFEEKNYFEMAYRGVWVHENYKEIQVLPPSMSPSPEIFFINHLRSDEVYPIWDHHESYNEEQLFTVIEILYNHICVYDYKQKISDKSIPKEEFATHMNNLLRFYKGGYSLDVKNGFIMEQPNDSLLALLKEEPPKEMGAGVIEQLKTAMRMFYRYDANEESRKKAINILADILEPLREELKRLLNKEYETNKNKHDKIIFGIVNDFNIRHNNEKQLTEYNKGIWYEWMMHYYTSVIYAYYKLKSEMSEL